MEDVSDKYEIACKLLAINVNVCPLNYACFTKQDISKKCADCWDKYITEKLEKRNKK